MACSARIVAAFAGALLGGLTDSPARALSVAQIVVPRAASESVLRTAGVLQHYIQASTGATFPIVPDGREIHGIQVGDTFLAQTMARPPLDEDAFQFRSTATDFFIRGGSDWGTEFGGDEFLERFLGIRWLMPTVLGEDVPVHPAVDLPSIDETIAPVYLSRQFSPLDLDGAELNLAGRAGDPFYTQSGSFNGANRAWARFNRARGRIAFHHNLIQLYPPSKYVAPHPEYFPLVDGRRYLPANDDPNVFPRWQPNFSAPGIAAEGARTIRNYFRLHPGASSYSLGMNDTTTFDESPASRMRRSGRTNYLQEADVSDDYFAWANEVAAGVGTEFPDKWLGTLAYHNLSDPPSRTVVNARIVPFLTYERMRWIDPQLQASGQSLTERWLKVSSNLGWYDYAYGCQYLVPRVWFHQMGSYLRWGAAHGVRFNYAELYPNWGEGPKAWLYAKLLWNPNQDVDGLLTDWYRHAAGQKAAAYLAEYYRLWEQFWTHEIERSSWNTPRGQYLPFSDLGYLNDVSDALVCESGQLLQTACDLADTPRRKLRCAALAKEWKFYELSICAYRRHREFLARGGNEPAGLLAQLKAVPAAADLSAQRQAMLGGFASSDLDALIYHCLTESEALDGRYWGLQPIWRAARPALADAAIRHELESLAASPLIRVAAQASAVRQISPGDWARAASNSGPLAAWGGPSHLLIDRSKSVSLAQTLPLPLRPRALLVALRSLDVHARFQVTIAINGLNRDAQIVRRLSPRFPGFSGELSGLESLSCALPFGEPGEPEISRLMIAIKIQNLERAAAVDVTHLGWCELPGNAAAR